MSATATQNHTSVSVPSKAASQALELARFGSRFWALLFDVWLLWFWAQPVGRLIGNAFGDPEILGPLNLTTAIVLLAAWAYFVIATALTGGTLGKRALRLCVVSDDYQRPGWGTVFYREVVGRILSGSSLFIGYLWAAFDKNKQAWHDKVADTYVMRKVNPIPFDDPWEEPQDED